MTEALTNKQESDTKIQYQCGTLRVSQVLSIEMGSTMLNTILYLLPTKNCFPALLTSCQFF